jgi:hypothetical protein
LLAVCKQLRRFTLTFGVLAAMAVAGNASAAPLPLNTGVEIPNNSGVHLGVNYDRAQATDIKFVRMIIEWSSIETSAGSYNWASLDNRVRMAAARGLTPVITVWKAPSWALGCSRPTRPGTCEPNAQMFGEFGAVLANRYDGNTNVGGSPLPEVNYWEVWNEPNLDHFLNLQRNPNGTWHSPSLYRNMLNAFYTKVHDANSDSFVIAGATAPFKRKVTQPGPKPFMRGVLCLTSTNKPAGGCTSDATKPRFDAWSTHPYTGGGPTHHAIAATDVSLGDLPEMRAILNAGIRYNHISHLISPVRFWVGEFSWDTNAPDPKALPKALHARWVSEALYRSWRAGVSTFIWHQMRDRALPATAYQSGFYFCGLATTHDDGLTNDKCDGPLSNWAGDVRKLSWRSFFFPFVAYAGSGRLTIWGKVPGALPLKQVVIWRKTSAGWRKVTTATSNSVGIFSKRVLFSRTRGLIKATVTGIPEDFSNNFSLVRPRDRSVAAFGCGGGIPCPTLH